MLGLRKNDFSLETYILFLDNKNQRTVVDDLSRVLCTFLPKINDPTTIICDTLAILEFSPPPIISYFDCILISPSDSVECKSCFFIRFFVRFVRIPLDSVEFDGGRDSTLDRCSPSSRSRNSWLNVQRPPDLRAPPLAGCDSRSPQITPLPLNHSMDIEFFLEKHSKPMLFYILSISWFIYKKNSYDSLWLFVITNVQEEYNLCRMITKVQIEPNCELSSLISSLLTL